MNFNELYKKVNDSEVFKDFINKNPTAELCAGFFIIDFMSNDEKSSIDYKIDDKIFTFEYKDKVKINEDRMLEIPDKTFPQLEAISPEIKVEVNELKSISGIKALDEGINAKFNKIIAVLQKYNHKQIWNLTCMLDGLIILNIHIDSISGEILKFERKSMMDLVRKK